MSNVVRSAAVRLTMENASYIRGANQAATATEAATGRMQRSVRNAAATTGRDWETMGRYGGRYALAVGAGLGAVVKTTADFASEMALVRTLSHANQGEMDALSKAALTVGRNIGYSAKEVAQGEEEMIKAGVSVKDILGGGLKGALDLAAAGQTDVATATTIAAPAMTQFKLQGKDIPHLADLLSAGADKALGSVEDLGYGLEQSGTTAHQMGLSVEQTVGTLAAFAQAGLIGERGGTTFKQMLLQLSAPTSVAQKLMDKLGISLYNANGQIKTMPQLADNLQKSLSGLTPAQRNAALGVIFGSRAIQGANILMADGRTEIAKWISKVNDQGFAAGQASGKLDSLTGDVKKFKATLSTTFIQAGSPSQGALRELVQDADHLVRSFSHLPGEVQQGIVKVAALTAGVGATLYVVGKVHKAVRELGGFGLGRGAAAGGLGRAASLASPVPVFVTNMGPGGLAGEGRGGGTTVLGGGAKAAEGKLFGKIPLTAVSRANIGVGLAAMVLEALGVGSKTHAGSTLSLAGAGSFLGVPGTVGGAILGGGIDIYHAGGSTKSALDRANAALASGDIKQMKAALTDLQNTAIKLGSGGASQNFNRFVTQITGRRKDIEDTAKALEEAVNPKMRKDTRASLDYLLTLGKKGHTVKPPKVEAPSLDSLLDTTHSHGRKPKQMTSEQVLADLYGINPKKLKPVNLLDQITGIADVFGTGKGPSKKAQAKQFAVALGMDSAEFDRKWKKAKQDADALDATKINPKVHLDTSQATSATAALKSLIDSLHDRNIHINVTKTTNATLAEAAANSGKTGADGATVPKTGMGYADRHPYLLADGEEVVSDRYGGATRNRAALKAASRGARLAVIGHAAEGATISASSVTPSRLYGFGAGIDYRQLAAAVTGNQLLAHRSTRDAFESALRTVLREMPVQRVPADLMYGMT